MLEAGPPVEFVTSFGTPFPTRVIFEIFGVPERGGPFTEEELVSLIWVHVSAGSVAASNILPNTILTFSRHREQWDSPGVRAPLERRPDCRQAKDSPYEIRGKQIRAAVTPGRGGGVTRHAAAKRRGPARRLWRLA